MPGRTLEQAAANYSYLRGLFLIPLGAVASLAALANWDLGPLRPAWAFPVVALAIALSCLPIARYYNEHYGRIHPSTRQQVRGGLAGAAALAVVLGGSTLLRSRAGWSLDLSVNATAVTLSLVMLLSYAVGIGLRAHHAIIWGALLVAGALPDWSGADPGIISLLLAGVWMIVCGVFDHRFFVGTCGPPKLLEIEETDVPA